MKTMHDTDALTVEIDAETYAECIRKAEQIGIASEEKVSWAISQRACAELSHWDYSIGHYGAYIEVTPDELTDADMITAARAYIIERRDAAAAVREHAASGLYGGAQGNARWLAHAATCDACADTAERILAGLANA